MSCVGSPSTAMRSACIPAAIEYFKEKLAGHGRRESVLEEDEIEDDDRDLSQTAWTTPESRDGFRTAVGLYTRAAIPDTKLEKLIKVITDTWEADRQQDRKRQRPEERLRLPDGLPKAREGELAQRITHRGDAVP